MTAPTLELEIVTPDGVALHESAVEAVVVHRRERRFETGSEIALLPRHEATLIRISVAPVRYSHRGATVHLAVGGGFAEVLRNRVLIVTPRMQRIAAGEPHPVAAAKAQCHAWRSAMREVTHDLAGYA